MTLENRVWNDPIHVKGLSAGLTPLGAVVILQRDTIKTLNHPVMGVAVRTSHLTVSQRSLAISTSSSFSWIDLG